MASIRQKKIIRNIVANRGKSMKEIMVASGYSPRYAKNPKQLLETPSFRQIFQEAGLSLEKISSEWNKLLTMENKEESISNKDKISALAVLTKAHINIEQNKKQNNQIQFINKFINLRQSDPAIELLSNNNENSNLE